MSSDNIRSHPKFDEQAKKIAQSDRSGSNGSGEPPNHTGPELLKRVVNLESDMKDVRERLARIEVRLDSTATKAEISEIKTGIAEMKTELIKWVVGTALAMGATALTVMTFVLNNAVPKASTPPQSPIIIQVPTQVPLQMPAKADSVERSELVKK